MNKTAAPPESEREANRAKAETDDLAAQFLELDHPRLKRDVAVLAHIIKTDGIHNRTICITGGAGSGKSTLAKLLAKALSVKTFDLDEYIKGGYSDDGTYDRRLSTAAYNVWMELPREGWIVEHVNACKPDVSDLFKPQYAILVDPGKQHLKEVAAARNMAGKTDHSREERALKTAEEAKNEFKKLKGAYVPMSSGTLLVKRLDS
jgi:energy-coupling factor transporter ATP-binding protein EcfA2